MGKIFQIALDPKDVKKADRLRKYFRFFYNPHRNIWFATERAVNAAREKKIKFSVEKELDADDSGVRIVESFPGSLRTAPTSGAADEIVALTLAGERDGQMPRPVFLGRDINLSYHPGAFLLDQSGGSRKYAWRFAQQGEDLGEITVAHRFPRLLKILHDPDTKFVLSLGGGGLKVYAQSVIFRLIDALGARECVDEIWGTSGGAIGGLWYACGVPVVEMEKSGYDLYNGRYSLRLTPSKLSVLKNLLAHHVVPARFRSSGFSGFLDMAKSIYDFIFNVKQFRQPTIPFYCIAFNLNSFRSEILTPLRFNIPEYEDLIFTVDPIEAAVASSSVPVLFVPKVIKRNNVDVTYIDGMTTESVPMISIYKKWQLDRRIGIEKRSKLFILAARCANETVFNYRPKERVGELQMMMIYHDALTTAMAESQRVLIERDPKVQLVEISTPLSDWNNFDIYGIPTFIKESYTYFINDLLRFEDQPPLEEKAI